MQWLYSASASVTLVVCLVVGYLTRPQPDSSAGVPAGFRKFQLQYLGAWAICVSADWLQGPYVYALYEAYGISRRDNARLFVAGFGASFLVGTFVAGFADTIGRKRAVLLYCVLYIVSCLSKHFNDYSILMFGRITGGVATSLLFSAFESWLVSEHSMRHHFSSKLLSYNFSMMFFVNYLVAVCTGLTADTFIGLAPLKPVSGVFYLGGYLIAFDIAILALIIGGAFVAFSWDENYGDSNGVFEAVRGFGTGARMIVTNARIGLCCVVVTLFESSMYIFVFNWTPVLHQGKEAPPFGMIFSTFMMCCMIGASLFGLCRYSTNFVLLVALVVAALALSVPAYLGMSEALVCWNFWGFLVFEMCCGVYFPAVCTLKSECVPESHRSTILNLFRAPMNAIVVTVLLINPPLVPTFQIISAMLATAGFIMFGLAVSGKENGNALCDEQREPMLIKEV